MEKLANFENWIEEFAELAWRVWIVCLAIVLVRVEALAAFLMWVEALTVFLMWVAALAVF